MLCKELKQTWRASNSFLSHTHHTSLLCILSDTQHFTFKFSIILNTLFFWFGLGFCFPGTKDGVILRQQSVNLEDGGAFRNGLPKLCKAHDFESRVWRNERLTEGHCPWGRYTQTWRRSRNKFLLIPFKIHPFTVHLPCLVNNSLRKCWNWFGSVLLLSRLCCLYRILNII